MRCIILFTYDCGAVFSSPLGPITICSNKESIVSLVFDDLGNRDNTNLLLEAKKQLCAYFAGKLNTFQLPLHFSGTTFQTQVWAALQTIPYGTTISYRKLSEMVGSPHAFRAVGNANGKNPLPILIPCHRVIAHNGSLGGYSGGLDRKRFLLSLEGTACI
jgi:O-6-methylguanine DNA methyltransferase